jgi:hypothetical protein
VTTPGSRLVADLQRPEAYPAPRPASVTLVTTHISWVFLTDREVWKVKRPVDYGFLDYTSLASRRRFCEDEVRLNRRLAPTVYLGVVPVRLAGGVHGLGPDGEIVDYAVRMRRLPDEASADALLRRGELTPDRLAALARRLAAFYREAPDAGPQGGLAVVEANVRENFAQVRPFVGDVVPLETFETVEAWQTGFLAEHRARFEARVAQGRVREGHGDLRLEHVYFEETEPVVIDCIEFNERFRVADVASDVAFLAMELDARSRPDLAAGFLAAFAEETGDYDLYGVVDFYLVYRAWVRAKVACFVAGDPATPAEKASRKRAEARALCSLAHRYVTGAPPSSDLPLLAVGGLPGAGKSTLASALGAALAIPVIGSDRTRKALAGLAPTDRAPEAIYAPAFSERTFEEMFRRADVVLASGRGAILDATFRRRSLRLRAQALARRHGRRFLFVEADCDDRTLRERLRRRARGPSVSDATEAVLAELRHEFEPLTELHPDERLSVDTAGPTASALPPILRRLGRAR